jgi:hypothetical protein
MQTRALPSFHLFSLLLLLLLLAAEVTHPGADDGPAVDSLADALPRYLCVPLQMRWRWQALTTRC